MHISNDSNVLDISFDGVEEITVANDINERNILIILNELYMYEVESQRSISLRLKNLPIELKSSILLHALERKNLVNSTIILNIFNLIKGYNTFEDDFFAHPDTIFNTLEEFLDIKIDLNRDLSMFSKELIIYYLSIMKCCGVTEYTNDMVLVDIPLIYQRVLSISDIVSLSSIFMKVPEINTNELLLVNDAYQYMAYLASNFTLANKLMEILLNGNKS